MSKGNSGFGKNNFDKLEAAGLVAGDDTTASAKAKLQARATALAELAGKFAKIEAGVTDMHLMDKPRRLKRLTAMIKAVEELHASPLPNGSKKHVAKCLNEIISLREGVYASNAQIDRKHLVLIASVQGRSEVEAMIAATTERINKIMAESSDSSDMDEVYRNAADVIQKNSQESHKLAPIKDKAYVFARVPVVPANDNISAEKLARAGMKVERIGNYPVFHNQLVVGISPKHLLGEHGGAVKGPTAAKAIRAEADRLRKALQKKLNVNLQFVSPDYSFSYGGGTWFWLMDDKSIDAMATALPGKVKITRWGFAFQ